MPERSAIVLTDGVTPVTLTPRGGELGRTEYVASVASIQAGNPKLVFQYRDTQAGVNRQILNYKEPIVVTDSSTGEQQVRGNVLVDITLATPPACTKEQRVQAIKRAFSALTAEALEVELTTGEGQW